MIRQIRSDPPCTKTQRHLSVICRLFISLLTLLSLSVRNIQFATRSEARCCIFHIHDKENRTASESSGSMKKIQLCSSIDLFIPVFIYFLAKENPFTVWSDRRRLTSVRSVRVESGPMTFTVQKRLVLVLILVLVLLADQYQDQYQ